MDNLEGMHSYSDSLLFPLIWEYMRVAPYATTYHEDARVRNCLAKMIFHFCRERNRIVEEEERLPDPDEFFKDKDMGSGRSLAVDVDRFVVIVYCALERLNDPDRMISYDEHKRGLYGG